MDPFTGTENPPVLRFLGWDEPLVKLAAAGVAELATGSFPAEFSGVKVILPTAEAARMLKEELLRHFTAVGGYSGLAVGTVEMLWRDVPGKIAGQGQVLAAWVGVLRRYFQVSAGESSRLFPGLGRELAADTAVLLKIAAGLQDTRMALAREGWSISAVAERTALLPGEIWVNQSERFEEFDSLCGDYLAELSEIAPECVDPAEHLLRVIDGAGSAGTGPGGKIIVIDSPVPGGGVIKYLANCREEVEIWINAPEEYAANFDGYGIPDPGFWSSIPMPCDIGKTVRVCKDTAAVSRKLVDWLKNGNWHPAVIGVLNNEVADILCRESEAGGLGYDPAGFFRPGDQTLAMMPWSRLLLALTALREKNISYLTAAELLRHPYLPDYLEKTIGISAYEKLLIESDKLQNDTLAGELSPDIISRASGDLRKVFKLFMQWHDRLAGTQEVVKELFSLLGDIASELDYSNLDMGHAATEVNALKKCGSQAAAVADPELASALLVMLVRGQQISFREAGQEAIGLIGFAELGWRPEKELVIAGFNEESFDPDPGADIFLPETLRRELGISCGDARYAADAFRFRALCASRDMRLLIARHSADHQLLNVPRLLLQCRREELPDRINALLGGGVYEEVPDADNVKFPGFLPPEVEPPVNFSVTGFAAYLKSPFSFYLERLLNADSLNDRNCELDNLQYGTLVHQVLEEYGKDGAALRKADEIQKFCVERLERIISRTFARPVSGLVCLQRDLIKDSLGAFARAQEAWLNEGWKTVAVEYKFKVPWDELFGLSGEPWRSRINIVGKVDRVDMRELPGGRQEFMVMDYKTYASAKTPLETHYTSKKGEWLDLQLPLYRRLVLHGLGKELEIEGLENIQAGYFNLPLVLSDTGVYFFDELLKDQKLDESAMGEADQVLKKIYCDHLYWPPKKSTYLNGDDFVPDVDSVIPPEERSEKWGEQEARNE